MKSSPGNSLDLALKVAERQNEGLSRIDNHLKKSLEDSGHLDSLRRHILGLILAQNYDRAKSELEFYINSKPDFPDFKVRTKRQYEHAQGLIHAIKVKRTFPGFERLRAPQQQDLIEKTFIQMEELKQTLLNIEQIDQVMRAEDVRSTLIVVKALMFSVFALISVAIIREVSHGVFYSIAVLFDDAWGKFADWLFFKIGL